jgi:hypothetical protein
MKNLTLSLDEPLLRQARQVAAARGTSLNAMIREYLREVTERESGTEHARRRIVDMCRSMQAEVGARSWTRDDLHER